MTLGRIGAMSLNHHGKVLQVGSQRNVPQDFRDTSPIIRTIHRGHLSIQKSYWFSICTLIWTRIWTWIVTRTETASACFEIVLVSSCHLTHNHLALLQFQTLTLIRSLPYTSPWSFLLSVLHLCIYVSNSSLCVLPSFLHLSIPFISLYYWPLFYQFFHCACLHQNPPMWHRNICSAACCRVPTTCPLKPS